MRRHRGLWLYWPRSDEASGAVRITLPATQEAGEEACSGILKKMCLDVEMFSFIYVSARAPPALGGAVTNLSKSSQSKRGVSERLWIA